MAMIRALSTLLFLAALGGVSYLLFDRVLGPAREAHAAQQAVRGRLEREIGGLRKNVAVLAQKVGALKDDPAASELVLRQATGFVRQGENLLALSADPAQAPEAPTQPEEGALSPRERDFLKFVSLGVLFVSLALLFTGNGRKPTVGGGVKEF